MDVSKQVVTAYGPGSLRPHEAQDVLERTWAELVGNPTSRDEIAALFQLAPDQVAHIQQAPLVFEQRRSGMGAAEIAMVVATWVGSEVLLGGVKDWGKQAVKEALQTLWTKIVAPALRRKVPERGALGQEKDSSEGG